MMILAATLEQNCVIEKIDSRTVNYTYGKKVEQTCYRCGLTGHIARFCRSEMEKRVNLVEEDDDEEGEETNSDNEEKSDDEKKYKSGNVRRHVAYMVRTFNSVKSAVLMIIDGRIEGVFVGRIVIDTGETTSIMNEEVRKRINTVRSRGVRLTRPEARLKVVNNKEIMVIGETNKIRLDIGGNKVKMAFTVIEGMEVDCILGMDYLDKTKVVIFPSERKLKFPGNLEIYLDRRKI